MLDAGSHQLISCGAHKAPEIAVARYRLLDDATSFKTKHGIVQLTILHGIAWYCVVLQDISISLMPPCLFKPNNPHFVVGASTNYVIDRLCCLLIALPASKNIFTFRWFLVSRFFLPFVSSPQVVYSHLHNKNSYLVSSIISYCACSLSFKWFRSLVFSRLRWNTSRNLEIFGRLAPQYFRRLSNHWFVSATIKIPTNMGSDTSTFRRASSYL